MATVSVTSFKLEDEFSLRDRVKLLHDLVGELDF